MTRLTRIVVGFVLLELIAVAAGVPAARWPAISAALSGGGALLRLDTVRLVMTSASPLILLAAWLVFERRLASPSSRPSNPHKGYAEAGLLTVAFFLMIYQGWFASHLGQGFPAHASRELMLRAGTIFAGMVMAIQGNFSSKTPAPEGAGVLASAAWTTAKLRSGWVMSLGGLAIAVCAVVLPWGQLLPTFLLLGVATVTYVALQQRKLT